MPEWHEHLEVLYGERLASGNAALEAHTLAESREEDENRDTAPAAGSAIRSEAEESMSPPSSAASIRRRVLGSDNLRRRATVNSSSSSPHAEDDTIAMVMERVLDRIADRYMKPKPNSTILTELIRRIGRHQYAKLLTDEQRVSLYVMVSKPPHTEILYAVEDHDFEVYIRRLVAEADAEAVRNASPVVARDAPQISRAPPAAARYSDRSSQYQSFAFQVLQGDYPPQYSGSPVYYERGNDA
jgi:hypothetical protein